MEPIPTGRGSDLPTILEKCLKSTSVNNASSGWISTQTVLFFCQPQLRPGKLISLPTPPKPVLTKIRM